jgi:hypothetical protein
MSLEAVVVVVIIFCLRVMIRRACDAGEEQVGRQVSARHRPEHLRQPVEQGRSRTTRTAPPGNGNENRPAILVRSRSGNRAAILVPTSRQGASSARAPAREPLDSKAMFELQQRAKQDPMVNPLGHHPADYTPPELMLSAPPPRANPATAVDQWLHSRGHSHYTAAICDAFSQAGFPQAEWLLELQQMSPIDLDLFLEMLAKSPESMQA